jgi:hypothetical protein
VYTELATDHINVRPGDAARLEIDVTNTADVIDGVTAVIEGIDHDWVHLSTPVVSLFPESTGTLSLTIEPPPTCPAGEYLVVLRVLSTIEPTRQVAHDFWLSVEASPAATMQLVPSVVTGGKKGRFRAVVRNTGNVDTELAFVATDETRILDCQTTPPLITVPRGGEASVVVDVKGPRPWFGSPITRNVSVAARSVEVELRGIGTFHQKPRIPRGALTIAILAGIVALWATIFIVVLSVLRSQAAPTKAVAAGFNEGGAQNVSLTGVAASAAGKVTASTTGKGVERITVEAFRVKPGGVTEMSGSGATAEDGTFELASLLPGSYKLRFSADGYAEVWYPAAPSADAAEIVKLTPAGKTEGLNVVLTGNPGAFVGSVTVPDASTSTPAITVTVQQVPETAAPDAGAPAPTPPAPITVQTTGELRVPDLPTPGTYHVTVAAVGFSTQEFDETLAGGQTKVLNTVRLSAADGSFSGLVTDASGAPLGDVAIVVRSGQFEKKTTTPTAGNVGAFTVDALETPRTYVITFTKAGFSSKTVALDLLAGEARGGVNAQLIGGTGVITGTASTVDGKPIGGVTVTVARGAFTASTATLTTGTPGAFTVTDVPTPGTYTVTFSLTGFLDETRQVVFTAPGPQSGIDVTMRPSDATVSGTVTTGGAGLGGASIELSDGKNVRTTVTATSPAGSFTFANVVAGSYTLKVSRTNFQTRVVLVHVGAGDTITQTIDLPPA